ncbi:hypothetical protein GEMRC1_001708 [Eukaryota sp. GEM-RC1]
MPTESPISTVSAADLTIYAIDEADQAYGWGYFIRKMAEGHDDDYKNICLYEAAKLKDLSSTAQITGAMYYSVVLSKDGTLKIWGNLYGLFSDNADDTEAVDLHGFDDVMQVACASGCLAVLKKDGSVWFKGVNDGIFGSGDEEDAKEAPVRAKFIDDVAFITATSSKVFYLLKNGTVCYTSGKYSTPIYVPIVKDIVHVASGSGHVIFVDSQGNLFAMGSNSDGQLGLGDVKDRDVPVKVSLNDVKYVAAGDSFSLAVTSDGEVFGCGINSRGQLGDGTFGNSVEFKPISFNLLNNSPPIELPEVVIPPLDDFVLPEVEKPEYQFGISKTWGFHYDNDILKMWSKDFIPSSFGSNMRQDGSKVPTEVKSFEKHVNIRKSGNCTQYDTERYPINETPLKIISIGNDAGAILTEEGELYVFGSLDAGFAIREARGDLYHLDHIHSISAGAHHVLVLRKDGKVFSFGVGEKGQLGDGSNTVRKSMVPVEIPARVAKVIATEDNSFAITVEGELYAWGGNFRYLGTDLLRSFNKPMKLPFTNVTTVACSTKHLLVLTTEGKLFGLGDQGAIGMDGYGFALEPYHIETLEDIVDVAVGDSHSIALNRSGKVFVFGDNWNLQLGKADLKAKTPVEVDLPLPAKKVFAGQMNSAVILEDDSILICGNTDVIGAECSESKSEWRKLEL